MSSDEPLYDTDAFAAKIADSSGHTDPWNWTSRDFRRFASRAKDSFMKEFWKALADNNCDGQLYLTVLDSSMLKHYFNVIEVQHAAVILARVKQVRLESTRYTQWSTDNHKPRFSQSSLIARFEISGLEIEEDSKNYRGLFASADEVDQSLETSRSPDNRIANQELHPVETNDMCTDSRCDSETQTPGQEFIGAPLSFEDYLICTEDTTDVPVCQVVSAQRRSRYSLEQSYVQRNLRYAFMQSFLIQDARRANQSRALWKVHRTPRNDAYMNMVAKGAEAPHIDWIIHDTNASNEKDDIQLTDWFERIDWEARLARFATEDTDETLPPFGESSEDEEYESDVLDEMYREEEEAIAASECLNISHILGHFEVLSIIEQHKEQMQDEWCARFLPKRKKSQAIIYEEHRSESRTLQSDKLESLKSQSESLLLRQTKLVDSIAEQIYHSERAVKLQSAVLRETVYQLQENAFLLALLEGTTPASNGATDASTPVVTSQIMSDCSTNQGNTNIVQSDTGSYDRDDSALSSMSDIDYVYEDTTQNILDIDDDGISVVSIESSQPDSDNLFSSPSSRRRKAHSRYPDTTVSNVCTELILVSSDSESDSKSQRIAPSVQKATDGMQVRRQQTVSLSVPRRKQSPKNHVQNGSRLLKFLRKRLDHISDVEYASDERENSSHAEQAKEATTSRIVFARKDEDDHAGPHQTTCNIALKDNSDRREADNESLRDGDKENTTEDGAAATGSDQEVVQAMTKPVRSKKRKKKKRKVFDSDSEDLQGSFKRKKPKRPINEHAFARRLEQEKEREAIRKRAEQQITTNVIPGNSTIRINVGDSQEKEESILISPKVAHVLKAHQIDGVRFLWRETIMMSSVNGCLLAHSMGLGKTLQVIAYLETLGYIIENSKNSLPKELRRPHAMILCPASLARNWVDEFRKWVPECSLGDVFDMSEDNANEERLSRLKHWKKCGGVIIITYTIFSQMIHNRSTWGPMYEADEAEEVRSLLASVARVVVADEAHLFKNEKTKLGVAVRCIQSRARIVLTGSPLANNLMEYWAIMDWLDPDFFGSKSDFRTEFLLTIEAGNRHDASKGEIRQGQKQLKVLLGIIGGKIDRRTMDSLQALLPNKFEYVLFVKFTDVQRRLYNSFLILAKETRGTQQRFDLLMSLIAKLKLICNHPGLLDTQYFNVRDAKAEKEKTKKTLDLSSGERPICESSNEGFGRLVKTWREQIVSDATFDLDGPEKSAKVKILLEILKAAKLLGDKVLIFSFSIPTIQYLERTIQEHALGPLRIITGAQPAVSRVEAVMEFNELLGYAVSLISTKAGGQGLNMTGANRVVLFDHEFNPSWAEQAVGRAYRMGQTKDVHVYRLLVDGSFEIKLFQQALTKLGLTSRVVDRKNIQTKLRPEETLKEYFKKAPEIDRPPDKIGHIEDQLLSAVIAVCATDILSVEKTESFHIDEANELDDTDLLDIKVKQDTFWREREKRLQDINLKASQLMPTVHDALKDAASQEASVEHVQTAEKSHAVTSA